MPDDPARRLSTEIDEARPSDARVPDGTEIVSFVNSGNQAPDMSALQQRLATQEARKSVKVLSWEYGSRMAAADIARLFPVVEYVLVRTGNLLDWTGLLGLVHLRSMLIATHGSRRRELDILPRLSLEGLNLEIAKPSDVLHVAESGTLRTLQVAQWPNADLQQLQSLRLADLTLHRGRAEVFDMPHHAPIDRVLVMVCHMLKAFAETRINHLQVIGCTVLDLTSLRHIKGLRSIRFQQQGAIGSLDFVRRCTSLETLIFTASTIRVHDFSPLVESPSLKQVWLCPPVRDSQIRDISMANRRLTITNGRVGYRDGEKLSRIEDSFRLEHAL